MTVRTFLAVQVPLFDNLRPILSRLGQMGRAVKTVPEDGLHLTLKFLGDTHPELVDSIVSEIQGALEHQTPFDVTLGGLGTFPNIKRPAVVWVGVQDKRNALASIAKELRERMAGLGFDEERHPEFRAHLTLARIKSKPPAELFELLADNQATEFASLRIDSVHLVKSELTPTGPLYTSIEQVPLE